MKHPEYDSPFELVINDIATQMANNIDEMSWEAVQTVGINLDKEKLLIALKQDAERYRDAFYRGKDTGYTERDEEIIRCIDCMYFDPENAEEGDSSGHCRKKDAPCENQTVDMWWFCADGEQKEEW